MNRRRGLEIVDLVLMAGLIFVAGLFVAVCRHAIGDHRRGEVSVTRCSNNLKQIGMAAIQYADDQRFFPYLGPPGQLQLQGGWKSDTASRIARTLVYYNYNDDPDSFICPSSPDRSVPQTMAARKDLPLDQMTNLSYGWTRRTPTSSSPSMSIIAGDKSRVIGWHEDALPGAREAHTGNMVGNHKDAQLVVCVDGHTMRITPDGDRVTTRTISATSGPGAGFLGVLGDDPELGQ